MRGLKNAGNLNVKMVRAIENFIKEDDDSKIDDRIRPQKKEKKGSFFIFLF